jgi:hypothetical protein
MKGSNGKSIADITQEELNGISKLIDMTEKEKARKCIDMCFEEYCRKNYLHLNEIDKIINTIFDNKPAMNTEKYNTIEMPRCGVSKMDEVTIRNIDLLLQERLKIAEMHGNCKTNQESEYLYRAILALNERIKFILAL